MFGLPSHVSLARVRLSAWQLPASGTPLLLLHPLCSCDLRDPGREGQQQRTINACVATPIANTTPEASGRVYLDMTDDAKSERSLLLRTNDSVASPRHSIVNYLRHSPPPLPHPIVSLVYHARL